MKEEAFFKALGERIAALRQQQDMTQETLAGRLGLRQQVLATYETATRRVPSSLLPLLAEVLGVSVEDLLGTSRARTAKRGPVPKLHRQLEDVAKLPPSKQKFISEFLDTVLQAAS